MDFYKEEEFKVCLKEIETLTELAKTHRYRELLNQKLNTEQRNEVQGLLSNAEWNHDFNKSILQLQMNLTSDRVSESMKLTSQISFASILGLAATFIYEKVMSPVDLLLGLAMLLFSICLWLILIHYKVDITAQDKGVHQSLANITNRRERAKRLDSEEGYWVSKQLLLQRAISITFFSALSVSVITVALFLSLLKGWSLWVLVIPILIVSILNVYQIHLLRKNAKQ